jgi:hypothetical protein
MNEPLSHSSGPGFLGVSSCMGYPYTGGDQREVSESLSLSRVALVVCPPPSSIGAAETLAGKSPKPPDPCYNRVHSDRRKIYTAHGTITGVYSGKQNLSRALLKYRRFRKLTHTPGYSRPSTTRLTRRPEVRRVVINAPGATSSARRTRGEPSSFNVRL